MPDEAHVEGIKVRRHAVGGGYSPQRHHMIVGAIITHHADAAHRQQHGKSLPDVLVEAGTPDFLDENLVGKPQHVELLAGDLARATNGKAGARERVALDKSLRQPEFAAERAHLILEQLTQRLDKLHVHPLGQPADVMVRLDSDRWSASERHAFY